MCKKSFKNSQPFVKKWKNVRSPRGDFVVHVALSVNISKTVADTANVTISD